jgi:hypothetical protein
VHRLALGGAGVASGFAVVHDDLANAQLEARKSIRSGSGFNATIIAREKAVLMRFHDAHVECV